MRNHHSNHPGTPIAAMHGKTGNGIRVQGNQAPAYFFGRNRTTWMSR